MGQIESPKRRRILLGASEVFRELGFERATVDAIAARAGVSKATVYSHFEDKAGLFVACFTEESAALRAEYLGVLGEPTGPIREALELLGERLLTVSVSPAAIALYRHTGAETTRFPEMGQLIFERGPSLAYDRIAAYLARWPELRLDDPRQAAIHFALLNQGDVLIRAQLGILGDDRAAEIRASVKRGVEVFLRAYGSVKVT